MRRALVTAMAAASLFAMASTSAQAVTVSGDVYFQGPVHAGQDCPVIPNGGGFSNCYATPTGIVAGPTNDPNASLVVAKIGSDGQYERNSAYSTISLTGTEFDVDLVSNTLLFTYVMGEGDPLLRYITIKQAGGGASDGGYALFFNDAGFTSGTTYSFNLGTYFTNPGFSHITVYDRTGPVPEPATWAMMLLGFGGIGMAMRRSRRRSGALMQIA